MKHLKHKDNYEEIKMNQPNKVGLAFGAIIGGWHFVWSLLVFLGIAQAIYDFILWAHMIHLPLIIGPFDPRAALTLILFTTVMGYIFGYIAACVWNRVHR
ncbi:MAG: hypothetical protein ACHQVK_01940 [Candidatus Paceibacterales bacterium]